MTISAGVMPQILDWGLGPMKLGKIPVISDIGKRNCDVISKLINDFEIFLHSGITL